MSKQEIVGIYDKLDRNKYKLLEKGIAFELIITETGQNKGYLHTGIGTGSDMSMMALYSLLSIYKSACKSDIYSYAESVKDLLIKAYEDDIFHIEQNDKGEQE